MWYKTKDGVHEKVNDSFCATVNKAKDDVQGRRHAYIWDVEQDDPACIESEEKVMATGTTCALLQEAEVPATLVKKLYEGRPNVLDLITNGDIDLIINSPVGDRKSVV